MWLFTNNEKAEDKNGKKFIKVGKFRGMEDNIFLYIKLEAPRIYTNRVILQIHEYVVKNSLTWNNQNWFVVSYLNKVRKHTSWHVCTMGQCEHCILTHYLIVY